jgi:hypothetical protein
MPTAVDLNRARWDRPDNVERRVDALERRIRALVASAPPLPAEAAERLAGILLAHRDTDRDAK